MMLAFFRKFKSLQIFALSLFTYTMLSPFAYAMADAMSDKGREAQKMIQDVYANNPNIVPNYNAQSKSFALPNNQSFALEDMYPGTKNQSNPMYSGMTYPALENRQDSLTSGGNAARKRLYDKTTTTNYNSPTWTGGIEDNVYNIAITSANKRDTYANDVLTMQSIQDQKIATNDYKSVMNEFENQCKPNTTFTKTESSAWVPKIETCSRVAESLPTECSLSRTRTFAAPVFERTFAVNYSGPPTAVIYLYHDAGKSVNDSYALIEEGGTVSSHNLTVTYNDNLLTTNLLTMAELQAKLASTYVNVNSGNLTSISGHGVLELSKDNTKYKKYRITLNGQNQAVFKQRFAAIYMSNELYEQKDGEGKIIDNCLKALEAVTKKTCSTGSIKFEDSFSGANCRSVNLGGDTQALFGNVKLCKTDKIYQSPFPVENSQIYADIGMPAYANKAVATGLMCNFKDLVAKGQLDCYTDVNGVQQCPSTDGTVNTCSALETNPECKYLGKECLGGSMIAGTCAITLERYDCGKTVKFPDAKAETKYDCSNTSFRCGGDDCSDFTKTQSSSFSKAAALLSAVDMASKDTSCTVTNTTPPTLQEYGRMLITGKVPSATTVTYESNKPADCRIFKGEALECKRAVGGMQDCCKQPNVGGPGVLEYVSMIYTAGKMDTKLMQLSNSGVGIGSAYRALRDPVVTGFSKLTAPISNMWDSVTGGMPGTSITTGVTEMIDSLKEKAYQKFGDIVGDVFGEQAKNAIMGNGTTTGLLTQAGSLMSTLMTAYTIYTTVVLIVQIVWACEKSELVLAAKKKINSCTRITNYCREKIATSALPCIEEREAYCCFNSPLARIINEQANPQLGKSFGYAKCKCTLEVLGQCMHERCNLVADCSGLSIQQMADLDWSKIDLSEWTATLFEANVYKLPENINVNNLTGGAMSDSIDGRKNVIERTNEKLDGVTYDGLNRTTVDVPLYVNGDTTTPYTKR